jgi:hypothetical protein
MGDTQPLSKGVSTPPELLRVVLTATKSGISRKRNEYDIKRIYEYETATDRIERAIT